MTNNTTHTPAAHSANEAVRLITAASNHTKADLARELGIHPAGITRRFQAASWTLTELEAVCGLVGAPMTVLFDAESLYRFLAERASGTTPDLGKRSTKWYVHDLVPTG
jgi:hypothetical protein